MESTISDALGIEANYGLIIGDQGDRITVADKLENLGNILALGHFSFEGTSLRNHGQGTMIFNSSFDMYHPYAIFDNYGRVSFLQTYGTPSTTRSFHIRGMISNFGRFLIDHDNFHCNILPASSALPKPIIKNRGSFFEISARTHCANALGSVSGLAYEQTLGETIIDGVFDVQSFKFRGGTLSGNGILKVPGLFLQKNSTISPGSPVGTLTIDTANLFTTFGSVGGGIVNIELQGPKGKNDHLHVTGKMSFSYFMTLNVVLSNGWYKPKSGGVLIFNNVFYKQT